MADDLEETIRRAAEDPASAAVDGQSVQARPIPDLIAAHNHLVAKEAKRRNHGGLIFRRMEPGGTG